MFSQTPVGVSRLGPGRHLETAGEEGPGPGVNTCNRQELQLAGVRAGEELAELAGGCRSHRQTDRQMGDTRSNGQALAGWSPFQRRSCLGGYSSGGNECRPLENEFTALLPSPPLLWAGPRAAKGGQLVVDLLVSF